jgi:chromosome segregation ATPase
MLTLDSIRKVQRMMEQTSQQSDSGPVIQSHPTWAEVDELRTALAAAQAEVERLNERLQLAGGYHERTEREVEIEAALSETPESERDPADVAIAELLALVDAGRNRVHQAEAEVKRLRSAMILAEAEQTRLRMEAIAAQAEVERLRGIIGTTKDGVLIPDAEHLFCPKCGNEVTVRFTTCHCYECEANYGTMQYFAEQCYSTRKAAEAVRAAGGGD